MGTARQWRDMLGKAMMWLAGGCGLAGLLLAAGASLRLGALLFATAVTVFGAGKLLAGDGDHAVDVVIFVVGVFSMLGVLGHLLGGL